MPKRIIVIEGDRVPASTTDLLSAAGFKAIGACNWKSALERFAGIQPDAVILDISEPGMDGYSVCKVVREQFDGPIIILSTSDDEIDEVVAFEIGADDFVSKPIRPRALIARLRSHLRNVEHVGPLHRSSMINVGNMGVCASSRSVTIDGQGVSVTSAEFDLLWHLAQRAGKVVGRKSIYQTLMGLAYDGVDRTIDLRISRLRKKLGDDPVEPRRIKSVRGVGYILAT